MIKTAVITSLYYHPSHPSGSSFLAYEHALGLAEIGWKVWFIALDQHGNQPEYMQTNGLHVLQYRVPQYSLFDPRRMGIHQALVKDLLRRYVVSMVDLIHGHTLLAYDGALGHFGNQPRKAYSIHSPVKLEMLVGGRGQSTLSCLKQNISATLLHQMEYRLLENSDVLTSDSEYTRRTIGQLHNPELGERIQVVPGWVDLERFQIAHDRQRLKQKLRWPLDVPVLFTLRRLVPRNGIDKLLEALAMVKSKGYRFQMFIGGAGPLLAELESMAEMLQITDCVRLLGFVADDVLPQMYAAADLFVLPTSDLECFGLITLEALACGRPVIATPIGAIPEVLEPVEPAWLTTDASPLAIAQHIQAYLNDELPHHEPEILRDRAAQYDRHPMVKRLIEISAP